MRGAGWIAVIATLLVAPGAIVANPDDDLAQLVRQPSEDVPKVTDLLKQGARANAESEKLPLFLWAAREGHLATMKELLQAGIRVSSLHKAGTFSRRRVRNGLAD